MFDVLYDNVSGASRPLSFVNKLNKIISMLIKLILSCFSKICHFLLVCKLRISKVSDKTDDCFKKMF